MPLAEARQLKGADGHQLIAHPVSCVDCHDERTMQLRVSRPAFLVGIRKLAEGDAPVGAGLAGNVDALYALARAGRVSRIYITLPMAAEERIKRIVDACHDVASASGNALMSLLALGSRVPGTEEAMLDEITAKLRAHD